jgi:hypothetical protein
MRIRLACLIYLATLAPIVSADNLPHECLPERGCREEKTATHDIGRGVMLTLPEGWTYYSYPQAPIPEMAGLREIRALKGGVVIAITPFPNLDKREISEDWIRDMLQRAAAPNVGISKEGAANFVSISHDELTGGYTSFSAMRDGERPFAVLKDRTFSNVTTFLISHRFVIFSVSVASEQSGAGDYSQALDAVKAIN